MKSWPFNKKKLLIAFSGGPDSVYLVESLKETFPDAILELIYFNHGLRSESEVVHEIAFVKQFFRQYSLSGRIKKLPVKSYSQRFNVSIEHAGRHLRRLHLWHFARLLSADYVLTAHHKDDLVETHVMSFLKGRGLVRGGIQDQEIVSGISFVKPLLNIQKPDILTYLDRKNIKYSLDSSNQDMVYMRNRIRHQILPILKQASPDLNNALLRLDEHQKELKTFLESFISNLVVRQTRYSVTISVSDLKVHTPFIRKWVLQHLWHLIWGASFQFKQYRFLPFVHLPYDTLNQLDTFIGQEQPRWDVHRTIYFVQEKGVLGFVWKEALKSGPFEILINHDVLLKEGALLLNLSNGSVRFSLENKAIPFSSDYTQLDFEKVFRTEIFLGSNRPELSYSPIGLNGKTTVKKYLSGAKVFSWERPRFPLIFNRNQLVWGPGLPVSEGFQITDRTQKILKIEWIQK